MDLWQEGAASSRSRSDVDVDAQKVIVSRTKDEIKDSPEFDEARYRESGYRDEVGAYYSRDYPGRDIP